MHIFSAVVISLFTVIDEPFGAYLIALDSKFDNTKNINNILKLKYQLSKLLGYSNISSMLLKTKMAKSSNEVSSFLSELTKKAKKSALNDINDINDIAKEFNISKVKPWDIPYLSEKIKKERFSFTDDEIIMTFQSRFGKAEWLKPYTDETMKSLPGNGVKSIQVMCPGFSADCLETIEEIGEENREYFMEAGGEKYEYIPALNSDEAHIDMLFDLVKENLHGWTVNKDTALRAGLARALGADK